MILRLLIMLLLASPAFAAGDDGEALCDDTSPMGSGITCHCSEPLTANDGANSGTYNPTSTLGCSNGNSVNNGTSIPSNTVHTDTGLGSNVNLITSGSSYVLKLTSNNSKVTEFFQARPFTNKTYCMRSYHMRHPNWECNSRCNIKGPRFDQRESEGDNKHVGVQSSWNKFEVDPGMRIHLGAYNNVEIEGSGTLFFGFNQPAGISFEQHQTGFFREEWCFDHNPNGNNFVFMRGRRIMVTGPLAGITDEQGPKKSKNAVATIRVGQTTQLVSNFASGCCSGLPPPDDGFLHTRAPAYTAYVMVVTKDPADSSFWIGAATEVTEQGAGPTPTPTASPTPGTPTPSPTASPTIDPGATPTASPTASPSPIPGTTNHICDDFNRAGPEVGPDWSTSSGIWELNAPPAPSNQGLYETSTVTFKNQQLLWETNVTSPDQYGRMELVDRGDNSLGFIFRATPSGSDAGPHYEVFVKGDDVKWEYVLDTTFIDRPDTCTLSSPVEDADWFGVTITGSGNSTEVKVYRSDAGTPLDENPMNWPAADCTLTGDPATPINTGPRVGIRNYTASQVGDTGIDNVCVGRPPSAMAGATGILALR